MLIDVFDAIVSGDLPSKFRCASDAKKHVQPTPEFLREWGQGRPDDLDEGWAECLAAAGFLYPASTLGPAADVDIWIWWPKAKELWWECKDCEETASEPVEDLPKPPTYTENRLAASARRRAEVALKPQVEAAVSELMRLRPKLRREGRDAVAEALGLG